MANDLALEMHPMNQTFGDDAGLRYTPENEPNRSENGKLVYAA